MVAVEMMAHGASGVLWCDGRRMNDLLPGSRIEVRKSEKPVLLARIHPAPFSERLVRKFALPIRGWRGPTSEEEREACDAGEKQLTRALLIYIWYSHENRMFGVLQQEVGQCNRAAHSLRMWYDSSPYAVRTLR